MLLSNSFVNRQEDEPMKKIFRIQRRLRAHAKFSITEKTGNFSNRYFGPENIIRKINTVMP